MDVCLSVSSIMGHCGVEGLLPVPMNEMEEGGLQCKRSGHRARAASTGLLKRSIKWLPVGANLPISSFEYEVEVHIHNTHRWAALSDGRREHLL